MSVSVCLSVTEVNRRIIANLGFKFRSQFTAHCGRGACGREGRDHRRKSGGIISRYAMLATARPSCYHIVLALIYCCCAGAAIFLQKFLQTFRATVSFYFTCANGVSNIRTYSSDPFRVWSRCRFSVFVIVNCVDTSSATGSARTHAHTHTHTHTHASWHWESVVQNAVWRQSSQPARRIPSSPRSAR